MNYLLDKKNKDKKFFRIILSAAALFIFFYFKSPIFGGLSLFTHTVFRPVFILGNNFGKTLENLGVYFSSKNSLQKENENLKLQILDSEADRANYNSLKEENLELKEILGRKNEKMETILSAILSKPNRNPYDTILIDAGEKQGVSLGKMVLAWGSVPIGRVSEVYPASAKVVLFSNPGEKTQVVMSHQGVSLELVGRGGGNFEMILPRDLVLRTEEQVFLPGLNPLVVAVVRDIISDPRNPFSQALFVSPVNIQELRFVEVEA